MKSISPCFAPLGVNPFGGNIQLILQLYYNGALYADVQRRERQPSPLWPVGSTKILRIVLQSLTGIKGTYLLAEKNLRSEQTNKKECLWNASEDQTLCSQGH